MKTAFITGGSSGFGLEFAKQLAAQKYGLVLVALNADDLQTVATNLREKFKVPVETLAGDLSGDDFIAKVSDKIRETEDLEILINDAGFGLHESLLDDSAAAFAKQRAAWRVMAQNTLEFSAVTASQMAARKHGQIINIASTSAWTYQGNYSALKHWVVSYTEGLAIELRGSGVTTTVICPAWAHTHFHAAAGLPEPSMPQWLFVAPEVVAKIGLNDSRKGKIISIPTIKWKIIIWFLDHGPRGLSRFVSRKYMASKNYQEK